MLLNLSLLIKTFDLDETKKEIIMGDMADLINEDFWGRDYDVTAEYHKNLNESKEHYKLKPIMKKGDKGMAQVVAIQQSGSYTGADGLRYNQEVTLKNAAGKEVTVGASSVNPEPPYKKGDTIEWKCTGDYKGTPKCSLKKPYIERSGGGGRPQKPRDYKAESEAKYPSLALSYAKDYHTANGVEEGDAADTITATADKFLKWLKEKS